MQVTAFDMIIRMHMKFACHRAKFMASMRQVTIATVILVIHVSTRKMSISTADLSFIA